MPLLALLAARWRGRVRQWMGHAPMHTLLLLLGWCMLRARLQPWPPAVRRPVPLCQPVIEPVLAVCMGVCIARRHRMVLPSLHGEGPGGGWVLALPLLPLAGKCTELLVQHGNARCLVRGHAARPASSEARYSDRAIVREAR